MMQSALLCLRANGQGPDALCRCSVRLLKTNHGSRKTESEYHSKTSDNDFDNVI